jgi:hypothetical protein
MLKKSHPTKIKYKNLFSSRGELALIISSKHTGRIYVQHRGDEDVVLEVFLGS